MYIVSLSPQVSISFQQSLSISFQRGSEQICIKMKVWNMYILASALLGASMATQAGYWWHSPAHGAAPTDPSLRGSSLVAVSSRETAASRSAARPFLEDSALLAKDESGRTINSAEDALEEVVAQRVGEFADNDDYEGAFKGVGRTES